MNNNTLVNRQNIQTELIHIDNFQSKWLINTNKEKSNIVLYHQSAKRVHGQALVNINGSRIPYTTCTKILGVTIDNNITLKQHTDERINLAKYTLARLNRFKTLNTNIQLTLYKSLCLPQVLYSPTAIIYHKNYGLLKTQRLQNRALKKIYSISWNDNKK